MPIMFGVIGTPKNGGTTGVGGKRRIGGCVAPSGAKPSSRTMTSPKPQVMRKNRSIVVSMVYPQSQKVDRRICSPQLLPDRLPEDTTNPLACLPGEGVCSTAPASGVGDAGVGVAGMDFTFFAALAGAVY
jgi:hypothetical protein